MPIYLSNIYEKKKQGHTPINKFKAGQYFFILRSNYLSFFNLSWITLGTWM